jgi:hypothetical protein
LHPWQEVGDRNLSAWLSPNLRFSVSGNRNRRGEEKERERQRERGREKKKKKKKKKRRRRRRRRGRAALSHPGLPGGRVTVTLFPLLPLPAAEQWSQKSKVGG